MPDQKETREIINGVQKLDPLPIDLFLTAAKTVTHSTNYPTNKRERGKTDK